MAIQLLCVFIGGGIGSALRFLITAFSRKIFVHSVYGTLTCNLIGCFLIGMTAVLFTQKTGIFSFVPKPLVITGFLGGLTTFSTFNLEAFTMLSEGRIFQGVLYLLVSVLLGLLCTYAGFRFFC
ncbi:fluoride efflux transporter CrcB [Succinivibrio sp.]|uniref:fluoride efflux transporter CrcB n=1 Tax=Succinivibrio sp. TaxID=2053619 RepID=UPI003863D2B1